MSIEKGTIVERVVRLEVQMGRVVSDIESEKSTRSRTNSDHEERLRAIEKTIWKASGLAIAVLAVVDVILRLTIHI